MNALDHLLPTESHLLVLRGSGGNLAEMAPAVQITWLIGLVPGGLAIFWVAMRFHNADSLDAQGYFRRFLIWAAVFAVICTVGIALDLTA
jgi:hypothetical protein